MISLRLLKLSDGWLWLSAGALTLIGFAAIFSTTFQQQIRMGEDPLIFVKRQLIAFMIALIGLAIVAYLDYKHLKKASPHLYLLALILLVAVAFLDSAGQGAQRWFQLGPFSFQPSEISKLTLIIILAAFLSDRKETTGLFGPLTLLALVGLPFLLVFKQPDLGTALVFLAILVGLLTAAGTSTRLLLILTTPVISLLLRPLLIVWLIYILALVVALFLTRASFWDWLLILGSNIAVGIALPFIWSMLKSYQQMRIVAFLNPAADPYGAGYHTLQSKIAIGGGGLLGKGFLQGTQTQLQFIPEQHSDFIFSAIGEEFGLLGALAVLSLFALVVWRALTLAFQARDRFGAYLSIGIAAMTAFHALANLGMTLGLLPVVGIPLPFVSYGGSSLIMNLLAVGILQSIAMRRHKLIF